MNSIKIFSIADNGDTLICEISIKEEQKKVIFYATYPDLFRSEENVYVQIPADGTYTNKVRKAKMYFQKIKKNTGC